MTAADREQLISAIKHIRICTSGGVNTHEDVCTHLGDGADMVFCGTNFIHTDACDADSNFSDALAHGLDDDGNIQSDPLAARRIMTTKSPAGYPCNGVVSPWTKRAAVMQKAMFEAKRDGRTGPFVDFEDIPPDLRTKLKPFYEQGIQIPGWHYTEKDFLQRALQIVRSCRAKCLQACGLTTPKGSSSDPGCILGPLVKAKKANGVTKWRDWRAPRSGRELEYPNTWLMLAFSGSKGTVFANRTELGSLLHYLKTGEVPSTAVLNTRPHVHDNSVYEMWNSSR
jgi:Dioxygenases related to 2-nitropropane dioxygenase